MFTRKVIFFLLFLGLVSKSFLSSAQTKPEITAQVDSKNITTEEDLVISVSSQIPVVSNEPISFKFPEINFFTKIGVSRSKSSNYLNGQLITTFTYSQHYRASNSGIFNVPALEVLFNQQAVKLDPFSVIVTKGINLPSLTDEIALTNIPKEIQANNKPFLLVSSSNYHPYVGQGFTLKFSLFIPENNVDHLEFDRNDLQIPLLIQKIKPANCWQENFELEEEKIVSVEFNKKKYTEYRFFQSTYFALDPTPIRIPSLSLRLVKSVEKGDEGQKINVFFKSPLVIVQPKPLPNKSMNNLPVGVFSLKETISKKSGKTGQKLIYQFSLQGDGNSILWDKKKLESDFFIDFLRLNSSVKVFPFRDQMFGDNSEKIQIIPKQPGKFALNKYFNWVYFNTQTGQLDTLESKIILQIEGKPSDLKLNTKEEVSELYQGLENQSSLDLNWNRWINWSQVFNAVVVLMFIIVIFVMIRMPK
ncbi:MAG: BatD family protein [Aquirufa sp.]